MPIVRRHSSCRSLLESACRKTNGAPPQRTRRTRRGSGAAATSVFKPDPDSLTAVEESREARPSINDHRVEVHSRPRLDLPITGEALQRERGSDLILDSADPAHGGHVEALNEVPALQRRILIGESQPNLAVCRRGVQQAVEDRRGELLTLLRGLPDGRESALEGRFENDRHLSFGCVAPIGRVAVSAKTTTDTRSMGSSFVEPSLT